mgnify:CR=1 FL=1
MLKNRNFGQKSKKNILKSKFSQKNQNFCLNKKFYQKKLQLLSKQKIFSKNQNFCLNKKFYQKKLQFLSKQKIYQKNQIFCQKMFGPNCIHQIFRIFLRKNYFRPSGGAV